MTLFSVLVFGVLASVFTLAMSQKVSEYSRNFFLVRERDTVMLDAISCIHFARLAVFVRDQGLQVEEIEREYDTHRGGCRIEGVVRENGGIVVRAESSRAGIIQTVVATIDSDTFEIENMDIQS